jgi:hypothetical protein
MDDYISPPGSGASTGVIELTPRQSDDRYSLHATATTQVTGINVYDALYVEVVSPATAEVVATGVPGTAAVAVNQPVLRTQGATLVSGRTFTTRVAAGVVEITPGIVTKSVSSDGTTASAAGTLAHIKLLDPTGSVTVADLTLGDVAAAATVPAGGVSCPGSRTSSPTPTATPTPTPTPAATATATQTATPTATATPTPAATATATPTPAATATATPTATATASAVAPSSSPVGTGPPLLGTSLLGGL